MLAVERDGKPRNMNFAKVDRRGGGGATTREGALIRINTVFVSIWFLLDDLVPMTPNRDLVSGYCCCIMSPPLPTL